MYPGYYDALIQRMDHNAKVLAIGKGAALVGLVTLVLMLAMLACL